jgi:hypothetical protein
LALAAKHRKISSWPRNDTKMKKQEREEKHSRRLEEVIVLDMDWTDSLIDMNIKEKARTFSVHSNG